MSLVGVEELCGERQAFLATIASLSDDDFDGGRTLCAQWHRATSWHISSGPPTSRAT